MPSRAQVARERERVRRAVAWWQRKLGWSYDISVTACVLPKDRMQIAARCWPEDPRAFDLWADVETVQGLGTQGVRELVVHELGHALLWPIAERATRRMSARDRTAWVARVEEPVVTEWARVVSRLALGRWSQR